MSLRPQSEAELAEAIRDASGPLVVRGGGTRALEIKRNGTVLETGGLCGITLYEPEALTLVARAGTPLAEIEQVLAAQGQFLPFEAPDMRTLLQRGGVSTIGGVVAMNASGPRRVQLGACRDSLIGVRFVTGSGALVRSGGRVMKNVTGYDLVKLMAGSQGRLGVLIEVSFKLRPAPEATMTLALAGLSIRAAVAAMAAALGTPYQPSGAAHLPGRGTFLRIEGFASALQERADKLRAHLAGFAAAEIHEKPAEESRALWREIRDLHPLEGQPGDLWRVVLKPSQAPDLAERLGADLRDALFDWGGGLVWLVLKEGTDLPARLKGLAGHARCLRGAPPPPPPASPAQALSAAIHNQFDPRGLFAPPSAP